MSGVGRAALRARLLVSPLAAAVVTLALFTVLLSNAPLGGAAGNVITSPDTTGDVGWNTSLALDGSGNPVVSYTDFTFGGGGLKVLHCGDAGCSTGNVITTPDTDGGMSTSLALDGGGNPVVSYYSSYPSNDLKVLHCGDPNCSSGNVITSPDTAGDVGFMGSMVLDAAGNPVVGYWDGTNFDLKVLHCGDVNCSSGNVITSPDTAGDVGRNTSLALDGNGNPVVSYGDAANGDLKVLHCGDATCSSGNVITSPDAGGFSGSSTSLMLDAAGNPVVSYRAGFSPDSDLKVLHCGDPNCSSGNVISSPDTVGIVGTDTSLTLDGGGNPVVSYFDGTNGDLKVLRCGDPNCSSGNVVSSPDTAGIVGSDTSLALDGNGNPVVSYHDYANFDLKVLHCGGPNCGAAPTPTASATPAPTTPAPTTPVPTGTPPAGQGVIWGDHNCSGSADPVDSLLTLRFDAGLSTSTGACPNLGQVVDVQKASLHPWGDVDCGGDVTPVDSLKLLRHDAGLGVSQAFGCPAIGSLVILGAAATPTATTAPTNTPTPVVTATPSPTATAGSTATATPTPSPAAGPTVPPLVPPGPTTSCSGSAPVFPIAIADNAPGSPVKLTLSNPGGGVIADLDVCINIDHTWVGDLFVEVEHINTGTTVTLIDRPGAPSLGPFGCDGDNVRALLADEAASPIHSECGAGTPTIEGAFRPNQPLSAFDGEVFDGTWEIRIADHSAGYTGFVVGVSFFLTE